MSFLNPALLIAGAIGVSLPILIHILMRRRRKPMPWAAMRFLQEAYKRQRRRLKLEQFLLLAARCLIVLLIGAALARPLFGTGTPLASGPSARTVWILIDDSLQSETTRDETSTLEAHKQRAIELIESLDGSSGDRVGLVTLSGPARAVIDPPSADLEAVKGFIAELRPTDAAADLPGHAAIVRDRLAGDPDAQGTEQAIAVLSGFRAGTLARDSGATPEAITLEGSAPTLAATRPGAGQPTNLAVESVAPLRTLVATGQSAGAEPVRVRLRRHGSAAGAQNLELAINLTAGTDQTAEAGRRSFVWPADRETVEIPVPADIAQALRVLGRERSTGPRRVVLTAKLEAPGDAVQGDNEARAILELRDRLTAAVVGPRRFGGRPSIDDFEPADWLRLALAPSEEGGIDPVTIDPASVDEARLAGVDAVWVTTPERLSDNGWAALRSATDRGALVVLSPEADEAVQLWPDKAAEVFGDVMPMLAREPADAESPLALTEPPAGDSGVLTQLAGELADLLAPVRITRAAAISGGSGQTLLSYEDGSPAVVGFTPESRMPAARTGGFVILTSFAFDLEWTDLPAKPLMVPLAQELTRQGAGRAGASSPLTAGAPLVPNRNTNVEMIAGTASADLDGVARHAGVWRVLDERGAERSLLVVNPDTGASDTAPTPEDETETRLARLFPEAETGSIRWFDDTTTEESSGDPLGAALREPLTLGLLIALLALVVFEAVLGRLSSHATQEVAL